MFTSITPKLPMRNKAITQAFYVNQLGFSVFGTTVYDYYLMVEKDQLQLHFFEHNTLNPLENYSQVYIRTNNIEALYKQAIDHKITMPALGHLETKPWGQKEFSIIDPDHNLLTFGQEAF
jgi:hypothetical protein